jgi:hypothetical protein
MLPLTFSSTDELSHEAVASAVNGPARSRKLLYQPLQFRKIPEVFSTLILPYRALAIKCANGVSAATWVQGQK